MADDLFDYEGERSAAEAAAVLRELADGLEGGSVEFSDGDGSVVVEVPDELTLELELEREEEADGPDEVEVEVELVWETPGWVEERPARGGEGTAEDVADVAIVEGEADEGTVEDGADEDEIDEGEPEADEEVDAESEDAAEAEQLPEPAGPSLVQASRGTSLARFQLFQDRAGEWRWRLVHRNGNIIATSGEGYTRRHNAEKGLRSVVANVPDAEVEFEEE